MSKSIPKAGVEYFVNLVKMIDNKNQPQRRTYEGRINRSNFFHVNFLLNELKEYITETSPLYPNFDEDDGEITIKLPSFYNFSLTEMLETYPDLRQALPNEVIYFEDIDFIYSPINIKKVDELIDNIQLKNYLKGVNLYTLLKTQCDHISKNASFEETLYFLGKKKLAVFNDLTTINIEILNKLSSFQINYIDSTIHKEAIKNIITDSLVSFYPDKEISFTQVCKDFDTLYDVIKNNYDTYISQFTFEKIKKEVEKFRTEAITRINKAFSDIQMQIITIPASLVVVASNLKTGKDFSFITNTIILLGALFFTVAVCKMCENQEDTLDNIKHEIDAQKNEFIKDPLFKNKEDILSNFTVLAKRFKRQKNNLRLVRISIYFSILLMVFTYLFIHIDNTCLTINISLLEKFYCL